MPQARLGGKGPRSGIPGLSETARQGVTAFSGWFLVASGFATFWNLVLRQQRGRYPASVFA
jgi:hypothetical protein